MPLIIEAGFDAWEGQDSSNDKRLLWINTEKTLPSVRYL